MNDEYRIMVVDDDPTHNLISKHLIRRIDSEVDILLFAEPEKAMAKITEEFRAGDDNKTLLFLDINMPFMTGWDFLDALKVFDAEVQSQFEIYIASSSIEVQDMRKAEEHPYVKGFISKPLGMERVKEALADFGQPIS